jgi:hypothetical protein
MINWKVNIEMEQINNCLVKFNDFNVSIRFDLLFWPDGGSDPWSTALKTSTLTTNADYLVMSESYMCHV